MNTIEVVKDTVNEANREIGHWRENNWECVSSGTFRETLGISNVEIRRRTFQGEERGNIKALRSEGT